MKIEGKIGWLSRPSSRVFNNFKDAVEDANFYVKERQLKKDATKYVELVHLWLEF